MSKLDVYQRQVGGKNAQLSRDKFNDDKHYYKELDRILDELFVASRDEYGWDWDELAVEAGLCKQTVINLGERWTIRPQLRTVVKIAFAVERTISFNAATEKAAPALRIAKAG